MMPAVELISSTRNITESNFLKAPVKGALFFVYLHNPKKGLKMNSKDKKTKYNIEYAKKKLKRIPLDVSKEKYAEIKAASEKAGESKRVH